MSNDSNPKPPPPDPGIPQRYGSWLEVGAVLMFAVAVIAVFLTEVAR